MNFKKMFFAFFTTLTSLVMLTVISKLNANSSINMSAWTLSFDEGEVFNVNNSTDGFYVISNGFSITYNDLTGKSQGGLFDLFQEDRMLEAVRQIVADQVIENGQTITYHFGGRLFIRAFHKENGVMQQDAQFYSFFVDRSIKYSNRISTNFQSGKFYYDQSIYFGDNDSNRDPDEDLIMEAKNLTTGKDVEYNPWLTFVIEENGSYEVKITDRRKNEMLVFNFVIDKEKPLIHLVEWNWMVETPMSSGAITSAGMKVLYDDNFQVNSMRYEYRPFEGRIEYGTMPTEQIFWRKGQYIITVSDMVGNVSTATFTITDYDLIVDPKGGTVGTDVTENYGDYLDPTMYVGYTRCVYLGANAPSQSRLDFIFRSSDSSIATISAYGTVTAHKAGIVIITSMSKENGKIGKIAITVLK